MKSFKKLLGLLIAIISVFSITLTSLSATAAEFNYGTFEGGMIPDKAMPYYGTLTDGKGFPNGNFEQGLKYWGHLFGKRDPKTVGKIGTEANGNHYFQFATENTWDGLYSVCFTDSRIKVGDSPSLLFKYSGVDDIQVILMQEAKNLKNNVRSEVRLAFRTKTIVKADSDDGWNIAVLEPSKTVVTPTDEGKQYDDPNIYLNYFIQIREDPTCDTKIDDLQIVTYDTSAGTIKDLDGKLLYNIKELNPPEEEDDTGSGDGGDSDNSGDSGNDNPPAGGSDTSFDKYTPDELIVMEGDYPSDDKEEENHNSKSDADVTDTENDEDSNLLIIIIAAAAVVLIGAGVGVFFVIKNKKNPSPAEETEDTAEEIIEE